MAETRTMTVKEALRDYKLWEDVRYGRMTVTTPDGTVLEKVNGDEQILPTFDVIERKKIVALPDSLLTVTPWEDDGGHPSELAMWEYDVAEMCNFIWQLVYPGKTDWEYRTQPLAHVRQFIAEKDEKMTALEADRDRWRTYALRLRGETTYLTELMELLGHSRTAADQRLAAIDATMPDLPPWPGETPAAAVPTEDTRGSETPAPAPSHAAARGIFAWQPGDEPAEVSVRRMRDAQGVDADLLDAIARDPAAQVLALIRRLPHAQAEDTVARAQAEVDGRAQLDDDYWSREGEQHVD